MNKLKENTRGIELLLSSGLVQVDQVLEKLVLTKYGKVFIKAYGQLAIGCNETGLDLMIPGLIDDYASAIKVFVSDYWEFL